MHKADEPSEQPGGADPCAPEAAEPPDLTLAADVVEASSEPGEQDEPPPPTALQLVLLRILEAPSLWTRAAAVFHPHESTWKLALLEVITGAAPESWAEQCWQYEHAVLSAREVPGTTVARWFIDHRIDIGSIAVPFQTQFDVRPDRRDSGAGGMYEPLAWPSVVWTTPTTDQSRGALHGVLVAAGNPAFLSFDEAARAFFATPLQPNRRFDGHDIVFREQDLRARIEEVRIKPAEAVVMVGGSDLTGKLLTISGSTGASHELASNSSDVPLPLPGGLPEGAWLALHDDQDLIDSRALDPTWRPPPDVKFDYEIQPSARIEARISRGEGADLELKRELPTGDARNVMKTIAAFANGGGGTVVFGVDDDLQVVGLGDTLTGEAKDDLTRKISDHVHPHVPLEIEELSVNQAAILAVHVGAGRETPYGVGTSDRKLTYYVRRGANSSPARPEDIRGAVHSRIAE